MMMVRRKCFAQRMRGKSFDIIGQMVVASTYLKMAEEVGDGPLRNW